MAPVPGQLPRGISETDPRLGIQIKCNFPGLLIVATSRAFTGARLTLTHFEVDKCLDKQCRGANDAITGIAQQQWIDAAE